MKVKELKKTVNVSWSPAEVHPAYLAAGSAAQQVDSSFSSSSSLEVYALNLGEPGFDLELKSSLQTQHKFQKLVWSGAGVIVGGCDGGLLQFYSAEKILQNAPDALLGSNSKHNGHVSALDINPYQKNLLASGASESEIFIWDLNNTAQPMAPGNRSQPPDPVQALAWNQQVQHILGSTFANRCVVWDLRKNEPIMKLSDSQSRTRWRALAWHPAVATQLCIASEDDQAPVIQLWDLRLAASPLVTLEGHNKGVMALSWCKQDSDLLLSAGKDGRVLCWNPNNTKPGGELLLEVSQQQQWIFDASWCPRNPGVLVCSSFDQQVAVHSLLGSTTPESTSSTQSNIMDSFGGLDSFNQLPVVQRAPQPAAPVVAPQLPRPPRWLKKPSGAKFAFGGKLVSFEKCPQEDGPQKLVHISQVVSEPEIVERATELDTVLGSSLSQDPGATERLAEYCRQKGDAASDQNERYTWYFLRANFMPTFRSEVLNLLGFKQDEIPSKFKNANTSGDATQPDAMLSRDAHTLIERKLANVELGPSVNNVVIPSGEDTTSNICRALVCGNLEEAVELCLEAKRVSDALIIASLDTTSNICRALVCGNLEEAVELCLEAKRVSDALIIASLGSQELLYKVQKYHLNHTAADPVSLLSGSLLLSKWDSLVQSAASSCWRDTLAALVTHTDGNALQHYCEMLGDKLSKESDPSLSEAATICYLCGMSPDALVNKWSRNTQRDAASLARLTELALLARRAAAARGCQLQTLGKLESVLSEYASRLAAQGCLHSALSTLEGVEQTELRERLMAALGMIRRASHQPQSAQAHFGGRARTVSGHSQKKGHLLAHHDVSNTYSAVPPAPAYEQASPWGNSSVAAAPYQPHQAHAPPPPAQLPHPPRPGSTGSAAGGGVITSRSKYKVDPSVQSAPLYNQYSFNSGGYNSTQSAGGYSNSQPGGGYNSPLPEQYGAASVPAAGFTPINPIGAPASYNPLPAGPPAPLNGYQPPAEMAPPAAPAAPARPVPPGWNDPPIMSSNKHKHMLGPGRGHIPDTGDMSALHAGTRQWSHIIEHRRHFDLPKQEVQAQAPITHPLFGVEPPPQHIPLNPGQQYPGQQYPGQQQYPGGQYQDQQYQQYPGQQSYPGQYAPVTPGFPQQTESPAPAPVAEPALPVQKAPLPPEHACLQTVLDALRADCAGRASNPQMKRKLEDVQKRLETLYDMLREYRLSENALNALHSCVQFAQSGDYENATQVATSLATGADFAAAASFLPGLKVLFQLAQQLQVYAR